MQTGKSAGLVDWLNERLHPPRPDPGPTDPVVAAAVARFYATPPAAIAAAYNLSRIDLGLIGAPGRVRR